MDVLPLARSLEAEDRRALAEEMLRTLDDDELIDEAVLDLVEKRTEYIRQHREVVIPWEAFEVEFDEMFGPVSS